MRSTMSSRRRLGTAAAVVVGTFALAACGSTDEAAPGDEPTTLSEEEVELRVTWWGGEARHPVTNEAIAAFEAEYPNISVVGEFADWGGYWDRLATTIAGGDAPDVIQMDELYLASYADRGLLADLSQHPQLDTSALPEEVLDLGMYDGGLYGMPISTTAFALFVNEDLLNELGLTLPDTDTWTWEELEEFAQSVTEAPGGEVVGISPMNNGYSLQLWARQHGEALFTEGEVSISPDTMAGYFELAADWTESGAAAPPSQQAESASGSIDQTDFSTGQQLMLFSQSTQIPVYEAATGATIRPVQIPTADANEEAYSYLKPGMYWSASAGSEHQAEAAAFIDFMVNSTEAGEIIGTERGIPANPEVREAISDTLSEGEQRSVDFVAMIEDNLGEAPEITPNGASILDPTIARYLQDVTFGSTTPEEAAQAFIDELQASIDQAS